MHSKHNVKKNRANIAGNKNRKTRKVNVRNREVTSFLPKIFPDRLVQTFVALQAATNTYATASAGLGTAFYMTSMFEFSSGVTANFEYFANMKSSYVRYRVLRSSIEIKVASREAVNYQHFVLVPAAPGSAAPATQATWEAYAQNPFAKTFTLAPRLTAGCFHTIRHEFDPVKIVGREYLDQDEYSGLTTTPTTPLIWMFGLWNFNSNTVTTGGVELEVKITNKCELFELDRTNSKTVVAYDPENQQSIASAIDTLEKTGRRLRKMSL